MVTECHHKRLKIRSQRCWLASRELCGGLEARPTS